MMLRARMGVILALPWSSWPITPSAVMTAILHHHMPGLNTPLYESKRWRLQTGLADQRRHASTKAHQRGD
jgi:hypothetical protein